MGLRELPHLQPATDETGDEFRKRPYDAPAPGQVVADGHGAAGKAQSPGRGRYGAAHERARDAYRDVPILKRPTWGHEVSAYFFLGGISGGATVVAALAELLGGERNRTIARAARYVAVASMAPCPLLLIADLGERSRFHHMLRIVKPSSPMNLGAWALTAHGGLTTLAALRTMADDGRMPVLGPVLHVVPRTSLSVASLPPALTLAGYTGVLLGTSSVPAWFKSPVLGGLFMSGGFSNGVAATALAATLGRSGSVEAARRLAPLQLASGVVELTLFGAYLAGSGSGRRALISGRPGTMLAVSAVTTAASAVLEAMSLVKPHKRRAVQFASGAMALLGGVLLRSGVVQAGHASAADREATLDAMSPSRSAPGWGPPA